MVSEIGKYVKGENPVCPGRAVGCRGRQGVRRRRQKPQGRRRRKRGPCCPLGTEGLTMGQGAHPPTRRPPTHRGSPHGQAERGRGANTGPTGCAFTCPVQGKSKDRGPLGPNDPRAVGGPAGSGHVQPMGAGAGAHGASRPESGRRGGSRRGLGVSLPLNTLLGDRHVLGETALRTPRPSCMSEGHGAGGAPFLRSVCWAHRLGDPPPVRAGPCLRRGRGEGS